MNGSAKVQDGSSDSRLWNRIRVGIVSDSVSPMASRPSRCFVMWMGWQDKILLWTCNTISVLWRARMCWSRFRKAKNSQWRWSTCGIRVSVGSCKGLRLKFCKARRQSCLKKSNSQAIFSSRLDSQSSRTILAIPSSSPIPRTPSTSISSIRLPTAINSSSISPMSGAYSHLVAPSSQGKSLINDLLTHSHTINLNYSVD